MQGRLSSETGLNVKFARNCYRLWIKKYSEICGRFISCHLYADEASLCSRAAATQSKIAAAAPAPMAGLSRPGSILPLGSGLGDHVCQATKEVRSLVGSFFQLTQEPRCRQAQGFFVCAEHVRQLEGESPFDNLMEVKS
jgi:hypothetical protein